MTTEDDIFLKEMQGVLPLKKNNKIKKKINKQNIRKKTTKEQKPINKPMLKKEPDFRIENINLKKSIRVGKTRISKKVDFHGFTLAEAENIFLKNITECYNSNKRCILFITGKGLKKSTPHSGDNLTEPPELFYGKIRKSFKEWVSKKDMLKYILSVDVAGPSYGGDGAFLVYLRKKKIIS